MGVRTLEGRHEEVEDEGVDTRGYNTRGRYKGVEHREGDTRGVDTRRYFFKLQCNYKKQQPNHS